jgi:hypothetical protein
MPLISLRKDTGLKCRKTGYVASISVPERAIVVVWLAYYDNRKTISDCIAKRWDIYLQAVFARTKVERETNLLVTVVTFVFLCFTIKVRLV